VKQHKWI